MLTAGIKDAQKQLGWMLVPAVMGPVEMPAFHVRVPGLNPGCTSKSGFLILRILGGNRGWPEYLGPFHP